MLSKISKIRSKFDGLYVYSRDVSLQGKSLQGKSLQNFKSLRFLVIFPWFSKKSPIGIGNFSLNNFKSLPFFGTFFVTIYTSRLYTVCYILRVILRLTATASSTCPCVQARPIFIIAKKAKILKWPSWTITAIFCTIMIANIAGTIQTSWAFEIIITY